MPVLIGLNAFFVAAEYALVAIRATQIDQMRLRGRRRAADAMASLKNDPASAIGAIQVCITMTNLLLGWIGEPAMTELLTILFGPLVAMYPRLFTGISIGLGFVIVTLLTVVLSELVPKAVTLRYVEMIARLTARPTLAIMRATRPLVWLMNRIANGVTRPLGLGRVDTMIEEAHSADEIRMLAIEAAADGVISPRERSVILNALALGRRTARQIMIPRHKVAYLDLQRTMEENRLVLNRRLYSRLPLCDGGLDHVVGLILTREFLAAYNESGDVSVLNLIARPAVFAPAGVSLDRLLTLFSENRTEFLMVVDEYGQVEGIVTLRDVVDELIDPRGAESRRPGSAEGPFVVSGEMPIHEVATALGRDGWGSSHGVVTIGGLVVARLGHIPSAGEEADVEGIRLRVVEATPRLVKRVSVEAGDAAT